MSKSRVSEATGRAGVHAVGLIFEHELGWIFREQHEGDYGVDAQVEVFDEAEGASGRLLALQIKSGPSFFRDATESGFTFRGSRRHLAYWRRHSLPVVVILHDPRTNRCYWQAVWDDLIDMTPFGWKLQIPRSQELSLESADALAEMSKVLAIDSTRKLSRRLMALFLVLFAAAIVTAAVMADQARTDRSTAERREQAELARKLAALSTDRLKGTPDQITVSALLAVESVRRLPSPETITALEDATRLLPPILDEIQLDGFLDVINSGINSDTIFAPLRGWDWNLSENERFIIARTKTELFVWDTTDGEQVGRVPLGLDVARLAISGDGSRLAIAEPKGAVKILNADGSLQKELAVPLGSQMDSVEQIGFGPDDSYFYVWTGSFDSAVSIFDTATWSRLFTVGGSDFDSIGDVKFSPDSEVIAVAARERLALIQVKPYSVLASVSDSIGYGTQLAFSDDRSLVAYSSESGVISVLETTSDGPPLAVVAVGDEISSLAFSHDKRYLAIGVATRVGKVSLRLWDLTEGREVFRSQLSADIGDRLRRVVFAPNDALIAIANGRTVQIVDSVSGRETKRVAFQSEAISFRFSSDSSQLFALSLGGTMRTTAISDDSIVADLGESAFSHQFSPDGRYLVAATDPEELPPAWQRTRRATVWDTNTGKKVFEKMHPVSVFVEGVSGDGKSILLSRYAHEVFVLGVSSGEETTPIPSGRAAIDEAGHLIAFGQYGEDGSLVGVMRIADNHLLWRSKVDGYVSDLTFSPDGRAIAVGVDHRGVVEFSAASGDRLATLSSEALKAEADFSDIKYSPDGRLLAVAVDLDAYDREESEKPPVSIWESGTSRLVSTLPPGQSVNGMAFSPDSRFLATWAYWSEPPLRLWRVDDGSLLEESGIPVLDASFSSNGRHLLALSGTVLYALQWNPEHLIEETCSRLARNMSRAEWREAFGEVPYSATCENLP